MGQQHLKPMTDMSTFDATSDEYKGGLLALVAWREAAGEGSTPAERLESMRLVMHVIRNRVAADPLSQRGKGFGRDWDTEITKRNEFTSMSFKSDNQTVVWPDDNVDLWLATLALARCIYYGQDTDVSRGALWYYNPKTSTSPWFENNIVKKPEIHPQVLKHRNHIFFA